MPLTLVEIKKIGHAKNRPKFGLNSANYQKIGLADWHTLEISQNSTYLIYSRLAYLLPIDIHQKSAKIQPILFIAD